MKNVNYASGKTPEEYKCHGCGKTGVKLWREYQRIKPKLLCAECAAEDQKEDISKINLDGSREIKIGMTDTIGWYVPAVPDEEGLGFWGYTSVPDAGVNWWKHLPLALEPAEEKEEQ